MRSDCQYATPDPQLMRAGPAMWSASPSRPPPPDIKEESADVFSTYGVFTNNCYGIATVAVVIWVAQAAGPVLKSSSCAILFLLRAYSTSLIRHNLNSGEIQLRQIRTELTDNRLR